MYWAQIAELQQDQAQRDKTEVDEKRQISNFLQGRKNWLYMQMIGYKDNDRMIKHIVAEVDKYAHREDIHPHDVQLVSPSIWTQTGKILFELRPHPDLLEEEPDERI
jgi:hypothetical protein